MFSGHDRDKIGRRMKSSEKQFPAMGWNCSPAAGKSAIIYPEIRLRPGSGPGGKISQPKKRQGETCHERKKRIQKIYG
jgi:hypothetical protein